MWKHHYALKKRLRVESCQGNQLQVRLDVCKHLLFSVCLLTVASVMYSALSGVNASYIYIYTPMLTRNAPSRVVQYWYRVRSMLFFFSFLMDWRREAWSVSHLCLLAQKVCVLFHCYSAGTMRALRWMNCGAPKINSSPEKLWQRAAGTDVGGGRVYWELCFLCAGNQERLSILMLILYNIQRLNAELFRCQT